MNDKTRRLRKYEAEAVACASDESDPRIDFHSPFGPMIARSRLPETLVGSLNAHADAMISPGRGSEFLLPGEVACDGGPDSRPAHAERKIRRCLAGVEDT